MAKQPSAMANWHGRSERGLALRAGLRALMPDAPEAEFWEALASRLHAVGLRVTDAVSTEEIHDSVLCDVRNLPKPDSLPLPLRDKAFRDRIDPRDATDGSTARLQRVSDDVLDEALGSPAPRDALA